MTLAGPTVSVVMTSHNPGSYLRAAVESVLAQTLTDIEVLLIDDGSTDGSLDSIADIDDPRLRVERQANAGLGTPVNRWLREANGTFIMRMDADDLIHPERAERQVDFLLATPKVGIVGSQYRFFNDHGDGPTSKLPPDHETITRGIERGWHTISHATTMYRSSLIRDGLAYSWNGPGEDWSFFGDASRMTQLAVLDDVLYSYRLHPASSAWQGSRQSVEGLAFARDRLRLTATGAPLISQQEFLDRRSSRVLDLVDRTRATSGVYYRQAIIDQIEGRGSRSKATKLVAAALDPVKTIGWAKKSLAKRASRR